MNRRAFVLMIIVALCVMSLSAQAAEVTSSNDALSSETPIYRLYNPKNAEHLFTPDANEVHVLCRSHGWVYEGIGWYAPTEGGEPLYRLFHPISNEHLYTTDVNECDVLTRSHGWQYDNQARPLFNSGGDVGIYRLFNPNSRILVGNRIVTGRHHWTTDENEYNTLELSFGWTKEGEKIRAVSLGDPSAPMPESELADKKPTGSVVASVNKDGTIAVSCEVTIPSEVKEVRFAVWSKANGQDDLRWYTGKRSGASFGYTANIKDHKYSTGTYCAHAYATLMDGNSMLLSGTEFYVNGDALMIDLKSIPAGKVIHPSFLKGKEGQMFFSRAIARGDEIFKRINGKSYRDNPHIALGDLRYIKVLHYNFNGEVQVGEIIVNKKIESDILAIFRELYDQKYQIRQMRLVDDFWTGDAITTDTKSIKADNTSAFNYRTIVGGSSISNHALGMAIDLNPYENPYIIKKNGTWAYPELDANEIAFAKNRSASTPHVITTSDAAYKAFTKRGFTWGGNWSNPKDYQHFEKK